MNPLRTPRAATKKGQTMRSLFLLLITAIPLHAADSADLIIHNAKVLTVDGKFSIAEAVAIKDGRILHVGTNADALMHKGESTRTIDANGKMLLPGLMDSHTHPLGAALS